MHFFFFKTLLLGVALLVMTRQLCHHDELSAQTQTVYLDDRDKLDQRGLQQVSRQSLRMYADYENLEGRTTPLKQKTIKRIMNITASYIYMTFKVQREKELKYPSSQSSKCGILQVPTKYFYLGVPADLGIFVGAQKADSSDTYVAKSTVCSALLSNQRPIWGMIMWNANQIQNDQFRFQQTVYVGIHQLTHILGFSAELFSKYPAGNPLKIQPDGYFLKSDAIIKQIQKHFGCSNSKGLPLQDQDSTLISSHWQKKIVGTEFMIAQNQKSPYISVFTLALLRSSGWYDVEDNSEPTVWGKDKGCDFLNINNCAFKEFCSASGFYPDWDHTGYGQCAISLYSGSCKSINYYTNTICLDKSYTLTHPLIVTHYQTYERGGYASRSYQSNFHNDTQPVLDLRCYKTICSYSGRFLFISVRIYNGTNDPVQDELSSQIIIDEQVFLVCRFPGQIKINPHQNVKGQLKCPSDFQRICGSSKTCSFHCNKNGICINGQCLCTGQKAFSSACLDSSSIAIGSTGGFTNSRKYQKYLNMATKSRRNQYVLKSVSNDKNNNKNKNKLDDVKLIYRQVSSINIPCMKGAFLEPTFGICMDCKQEFGCQYCTQQGCIYCDDGSPAYQGSCLYLNQ